MPSISVPPILREFSDSPNLVAPSHHLAPLCKLFIGCSAYLGFHYLIKVITLPRLFEKVFRPLPSIGARSGCNSWRAFRCVRKKKFPVHFKSIPHKIELLSPFFGIVVLVREEPLWSPVLWAATVVSIGTHPQTSNLHLVVHPSQILMLGRAVYPCVVTLLLGDASRLHVTFTAQGLLTAQQSPQAAAHCSSLNRVGAQLWYELVLTGKVICRLGVPPKCCSISKR
ncbi:hypothetical protein KC353_g33 [Hortaea werneckii]|nr:hypothetical protein KC353_g33 [Hortaea werneckii]